MKNLKVWFIIAVLILLIIISIRLLIGRESKVNDDDIIRIAKLQKVTNHVSYFTITDCVEKYINSQGKKNLINYIEKDFLEDNQITEDNVIQKIKAIDPNANIKEIYESELENEKSCYVVYFSNENKYAGGLIIILDEDNQTFAVYPNEFVEEKGYNTIENIQNTLELVKTIETNKYNQYEYVYLTDKEIIQKYIQDYKEKLENDVDAAYDLIDDNCKKQKYSTLENFKRNIEQIKKQWNSIYVLNYERNNNNNDSEYIFEDTYNNKYIIKEKNIMEYTVNF